MNSLHISRPTMGAAIVHCKEYLSYNAWYFKLSLSFSISCTKGSLFFIFLASIFISYFSHLTLFPVLLSIFSLFSLITFSKICLNSILSSFTIFGEIYFFAVCWHFFYIRSTGFWPLCNIFVLSSYIARVTSLKLVTCLTPLGWTVQWWELPKTVRVRLIGSCPITKMALSLIWT